MSTIAQLQSDIEERETRLTELREQFEADETSVNAEEVVRLDGEVNGLRDRLDEAVRAQTILQRQERQAAAEEEPGSVPSTFGDLAADLVEATGGGERVAELTIPVGDFMQGILMADSSIRPATLPTGQVPVVAPVDVGRPTGLVDIVPMLPTTDQTIQLPAISWNPAADVVAEGRPAAHSREAAR